ncbi:MAG: hypothetical protein R3C26_17605 [Calditrichia bacterium]
MATSANANRADSHAAGYDLGHSFRGGNRAVRRITGIYRKLAEAIVFQLLDSTETTSFFDENLINGQSFHYAISQINPGNWWSRKARQPALPHDQTRRWCCNR